MRSRDNATRLGILATIVLVAGVFAQTAFATTVQTAATGITSTQNASMTVADMATGTIALATEATTTPAITAATTTPPSMPISVDECATVTPKDIVMLQAIQNDPTLTSAEELTQELALRKQLLSATITCATQDANALKTTLGEGNTSVQSQLVGKINDTIHFYDLEAAKVGSAGISGTEAIAKEMTAWRTANYVSLEGDVDNFMLWEKNQTLFETATNRMSQTASVVSFIQSVASANSGLQAALEAAQSSLAAATDENNAAGVAIAQVQSPDQTLALIQQSLQSLADTYQKFSDLNGLIQQLLPTSAN